MAERSRRKVWSDLWSNPPAWSPIFPAQASADSLNRDAEWIVASQPAMGTVFELRFDAATHGAIALAESCFELIDQLEMAMTIYRDDSTLSRVNATYHSGPVSLPRDLFELLELARSIHQATGGAYDIATGALSRAWGFVKGPKRVPPDDELRQALQRTGLNHVTFDREKRTVHADQPGVELNLGSIGKGYAIDRVVERIRANLVPIPAMVHGGRSSLYALGHLPGTLFEPWTIALHNPLDPQRPLVELKLADQAVGTSGGTFQSFESGGRTFGHIIDPRTGIPPQGPLSVTVVAPTAAEADALSTAFYLTGPETAGRLIRMRKGLGAIFMRLAPDQPENEAGAEVLVMNLPRERVAVDGVRSTFVDCNAPVPTEWLEI
jgi:thiamine biosynthesis lipoprotein